MKAREIRQLSKEELRLKEQEIREEIFSLRFQLSTGEIADHARLTKAKRDMARIKTILRERRDE